MFTMCGTCFQVLPSDAIDLSRAASSGTCPRSSNGRITTDESNRFLKNEQDYTEKS